MTPVALFAHADQDELVGRLRLHGENEIVHRSVGGEQCSRQLARGRMARELARLPVRPSSRTGKGKIRMRVAAPLESRRLFRRVRQFRRRTAKPNSFSDEAER